MRIERVPIFEDGSVNGGVVHQQLARVRQQSEYTLRTSSSGLAHAKHRGLPSGPGLAGQDVYGHTDRSIYVADGHGEDGQAAALATVSLVGTLEAAVDGRRLLTAPRQVVRELRTLAVAHLCNMRHERAGATFVQMIWASYRGRRWAVTVNAGDSEALLVYADRVLVCSLEHTWENRRVYQRYLCHGTLKQPKPVCYNRWNASSYRVRDPHGGHRPVLLYDVRGRKATVTPDNAAWVSSLWRRKNRASIRYGTQSVRIPPNPHENWGSCVLVGGRARGQVMSTFGDCEERRQTGAPTDMIHVYIHEIPPGETVVGVVQSDGVANQRTLGACGLHAWSARDAASYVQSVDAPRDDMSAALAISRVRA